MCACHGDHIQEPLSDCIPCSCNIGDFSRIKDRQPSLVFEGRGTFQPGRTRYRHAGHAFIGQSQLGFDPAIAHIEKINEALSLKNTCNSQRFFESRAAAHAFVDADPTSVFPHAPSGQTGNGFLGFRRNCQCACLLLVRGTVRSGGREPWFPNRPNHQLLHVQLLHRMI